MIGVALVESVFSPEAEIARFAETRAPSCGALVSFTGYCRARSTGGETIEALELDHYPGFTEAELGRLTRLVAAKHAIDDVLVLHRAGVIAPGEAIVVVAVASAHRAAAFAAAEELMDRLKTDAPFWKRERGVDGSRWVEPTTEDHARREEHGQ